MSIYDPPAGLSEQKLNKDGSIWVASLDTNTGNHADTWFGKTKATVQRKLEAAISEVDKTVEALIKSEGIEEDAAREKLEAFYRSYDARELRVFGYLPTDETRKNWDMLNEWQSQSFDEYHRLSTRRINSSMAAQWSSLMSM